MENFNYSERDISWLYFNHRVLQEAKDKRTPLFERIKFLAIYSSNLDEFFRVRVASMRSFKELKKTTRKELDIKPKKQLKQIRKIVQRQQSEFGTIFRKEILPELESHRIHLINNKAYSESQKEYVKKYFFEQLYPKIQHQIIKEQTDAPFLRNKGLYFIVELADNNDLAVVPIPGDQHPRFVTLPAEDDHHYITFVDDILRQHLEDLLNRPVANAYSVKLSRDAEMYIEDEFSGDLVEKIRQGLEERNIGLPTRFLYDSNMPTALRDRLKGLFNLSKNDLIPGARYHNFNDFSGFPDPTQNKELHNPPLPPLAHPRLEEAASIIQLIGKQDLMLHFPYQKYDYVPRLIWEAAQDPAVKSIKITLYRVASKSAIVDALLKAREAGKEVIVFIEAKARFDEASNLHWGGELEKAGANVIYSYPGIKVHTKLLLIAREEENQIKRYAYLGTGNFNEKTARLYCDHALLTADQQIAGEVDQVFSLLERKIIIPKTKHLFVSPFTTRQRFEQLINREIENARAGKEAYMILKMNSLEDNGMIDKLYEASQAGVHIKMIIRGICCLVPGIEGMSENIEVISIVDRFLEHARVYIFGNGGKEIMYTASADWMSRNLDRRVEVVMPIYDREVYRELRHIINLQLADNTKARWINASQSNPYKESTPDKKPIRAQTDTYYFLREKYRVSGLPKVKIN